MLKSFRLRPILASVLVLVCAHGAVCDDRVTTYESLFNDRIEITFAQAPAATNPLTDFPLLVKLSEGSPSGFSYARVDEEGKDIRFVFVEGTTSNAVPYEVDTWDPSGTSYLWVRVPKFSKKSDLKLVMYWAPSSPSTLPAAPSETVWPDYRAVWHMDGADNSSTNAIAATVGADASAKTGVIGGARGTGSGASGSILSVPAGTALDAMTAGAYTVTAWLRVISVGGSPWLYAARTTASGDAFGAELLSDTGGLTLKLHADKSTADGNCGKRFNAGEWVHLAVVHADASGKHRVYVNGTEWTYFGDQGNRTDKAGASGLAFGGLAGGGTGGTLIGDLDEVRVYAGAQTASWFANEYAQAVSSDCLSFLNFHSTEKPVYEDDEEEDDPSPEVSGTVSPYDYAGSAVFVPDDPGEGVALTNFVTLIKVWEGEPEGFVPRNLPFETEDIRFFDQDGNVLDYDIDLWDRDGESFFWVRVPEFSSATRVTLCWGLKAGKTLPENDPAAVWSDYAGVWHMTDGSDSTTNAAHGAFGASAELVTGADSLVGAAAGTRVSGQRGAILDIPANGVIDALAGETFTASGWVWLNTANVGSGALFSRATTASPAWGAQFAGTSGDSSKIKLQTGAASADFTFDAPVAAKAWTRFDCVYASDRLTLYVNGEKKGESVSKRTILSGSGGALSVGGFVSAAEGVLGAYTLNGFIDEFRLRRGAPDAAALALEAEQCTNEWFYTRRKASWDSTATLQNRWRTPPTCGKTEWNEGEAPGAFTNGIPWYGTSAITYEDRISGETLDEMPTAGGDYRAVFTVPAIDDGTGRYAELTASIEFRIRVYRPSHDLGDDNARILLLSDDTSVSDGKVYVQSYSDTARIYGRPRWVHDVDSGFDYTSTSPDYNFCAGLRHTYYARDCRTRLWDLLDVRYGNTYNNAETVFDRTGTFEEWTDGLSEDQNYLPWNPNGGTLVNDTGLTAEGWHEYAAQAVMCNSTSAAIHSGLYTNGIGTIYFDCVNSHADDAADGFYRLVVEMATNAVNSAGQPCGAPTDEAIAQIRHTKDASGNPITVVDDPYANATWLKLEMRVRRVTDGRLPEEDLLTTNELDLAIADGGTYGNFYRVYVPVDFAGQARFRIRRTAVNPDYTVAKDARSLILVDNVICSAPTDRIVVSPRGFYDSTKVKRETVGYEGAFKPSYPSVSDAKIYPRARATTSAGQPVASGALSSVQMHYRWRYLNQQKTDWMTADLNPETLTGFQPLAWSVRPGDLEYWYEANQSGAFYSYADYTGLGLGLPGYSEEVQSVTNRAPTYVASADGWSTGDWFTRVRDGTSTYGTIRLYVKKGEYAKVEKVEMFVARDRIWRGCLLSTNAVAEGIYFRFEGLNCQNDDLDDFQFNTNHWYFADKSAKMPLTGSVTAGTAEDWGHVPCDGATGHVLFQLDEETRALTVVHADWQDFNGWDDAHHDYFSGASTDDATMSGVSSAQREYLCSATRWEDDQATNDTFWAERFDGTGYTFYQPFSSADTPNGFDAGFGQWVRGAYGDTSALSGMALQMAGRGQGYIQQTFAKKKVRPRGLGSVRLNARIAQSVSPEDFAYYKGSRTDPALYLEDYAFLTRAAFDLNANSNFTGNASLSLAAFYQPDESCYEARWEQLTGEYDGSGTVLGPSPRGQRLALYRWKKVSQQWTATELYAATNADTTFSWKSDLSPQAIPQAHHSVTNGGTGLMPFMIGAYNNASAKYTLIVAAVHITGKTKAENAVGCAAGATIANLQDEGGWLYIVYRDVGDANRLTCGTYGVLAANCEGEFVHPQYHEGIVSWKDSATETRKLTTQCWPNTSAKLAETAKFYNNPSGVKDCADDIAAGRWRVPDGRMVAHCEGTSGLYADYNGFRAATVTQTVDIYTAPIGTTDWRQKDYQPLASKTLTGFGKPGPAQEMVFNVWSADDSSVRIRAGGEYEKGVRTDVVVDNIQLTQWAGTNWYGNTRAETQTRGPTNFVYTSGWIADGALQLSPRRTPDGKPCSLRMPLCDDGGSGETKRGIGLGSLRFTYRNAQTNACLLVQIATNRISEITLIDRTDEPASSANWTTVTNYDFSTGRYPLAGDTLECSLGLHGVKGVMRVIADNPAFNLRETVAAATDPTAFASVEIVSAVFRDEPALDKGCWWGFNIRTIGDRWDAEQRMYLPDNPLRSASASVDAEIGQSFALNNSVTEDCDPEELAKSVNPFTEHMPFLQTPTFMTNIVGEISFKARKWPLLDGAQHAEVRLYGTRAQDVNKLQDSEWELLNDGQPFVVSNATYETYRWKNVSNGGYRAFRFAVTGVDGVTPYAGPAPTCGRKPVRVLIDDVLVSEAILPRLAFRNVGAFRHYLSQTTYVPNVPSKDEQPICGESWGVQAEVYPAMLGEEIDTSTKPRVRLYYYKGTDLWGFENWRSKAEGDWLTEATDTNNFYRSSTADSPNAVVTMSDSQEVVQYMLEVVYKVVSSETGGSVETTNWLESVDWPVPSWYYPVDYNATKGGGFSAFAIIDEIAPGWAWINEVNLFGAFDANYENTQKNTQFVEVAKPAESSLDGWTLRMLSAANTRSPTSSILTNDVAVYGFGGVSSEKTVHASSGMTFLVVGNPVTTLSRTEGEYDGGWSFPTVDYNVFNKSGKNHYLSGWEPVAIQLVRASGVIEHEVAILGTNDWSVSSKWAHSSSNLVNILKTQNPDVTFFSVPDDDTGEKYSVGVYDSRGEAAAWWNNTMEMTPGRINRNQTIRDYPPTPGGELILVYANVDKTFGRIVQTVGAGTNTTERQAVAMTSGSESGVDIYYTVHPWCELGSVTEKNVSSGQTRALDIPEPYGPRQYKVTVAKGATKNMEVLAAATVDSRLRSYGLTDSNRYTPAVLHWLEHHTDAFGNDFYGWQGGTTNDTIHLATFLALSGNVVTNMTLTQMYWLDIDPTASNMFFRAGMVRPPSQVVVDRPTYDPTLPEAYTNLRMGVYMSISNGNGRVTRDGSCVWAPYVLRGLGEGELSWDYALSKKAAWTSETFKVTGYLNTGLTAVSDADAWIPLRYFVFAKDSFDANFESEIDIVDPFSTESPAYSQDWSKWVSEHGTVPPVFMSWNIDERLQPVTAEILAPTNRLCELP